MAIYATNPCHCRFDQALDNLKMGNSRPIFTLSIELQHFAAGLRAIGFQTLLPDALQAPIIVTILTPGDPNFEFGEFYDRLNDKGFSV